MTNGSSGRRTRAFTLVELLVVIAIIALLISILFPALRSARDQARAVTCRAQLSDFGKGFYGYSVNNDGYLCSGSFDPQVSKGRDGPVDKVGWVADLVNSRAGDPGKQLCPTNPARSNQMLGRKPDLAVEEYTNEQVLDLVKRGYNTNYCQSWYMGRSEVRQGINLGAVNVKSLDHTLGPLRMERVVRTPLSNIPLLGDGFVDKVYENQVPALNTFGVRTMTDGPAGGPFGPQDYGDFGPAHGSGTYVVSGNVRHNRVKANILFADSHVTTFEETRGPNGQRNGRFMLFFNSINQAVEQEDFTATDLFDGTLSLGRRSQDLMAYR